MSHYYIKLPVNKTMNPIKTLTNRLNPTRILNNSMRSIQEVPVGLTERTGHYQGYSQDHTNTTERELKDLTDQILVDRTLQNSRRAMEIDPTTWSSIISQCIITNTGWDIMGHTDDTENKEEDEEESEDDKRHREAVKHIKEKCREWDLGQIMWEMDLKSCVDGTCLIHKTIAPRTIKSVTFLLYDEDEYDFIDITDPQTGELKGYKQKYMRYDIPDNWEDVKFDELTHLMGIPDEENFTPDEIIMPKLFEQDGEGQSLVYKVLDYVYIKREIERAMPIAARRAAVSLGVEVGNKDIQFNFGADPGDTMEEKQAKQAQAMAGIADAFAEKEKKDLITYPYGTKPEMIGNGKVADFKDYLNYLKQEIRSALLTPDSRFESQSSNRAVAREQLSGSLGQVTVIEYLREFNKYYLEKYLIDHELRLAGYKDQVGKVFIKYKELELEDELVLAQIAEKLIVMGADPEVIMQTYFKRYMTEEQNYKKGKIVRYPPNIQGGQVQPVQNLAKQAAAQQENVDSRVDELMNQLRNSKLMWG